MKVGDGARIFMKKMKDVLENINTSLLSDVDIFYLVNSKLDSKHRISFSYFEKLKSPNNQKSIGNMNSLSDEEKEEFLSTLNLGRVLQKIALTERAFDDETRNAYPYLWSLERKNKHLQLKQNIQLGGGGITLSIEGGDSNLIDTIDIDYVEEPLLITKKSNDDGE